MDDLKIQIIDPADFSDQWESFSILDTKLSGEEWHERYNELVKMLSADFLYTGMESEPADFFVGQDWCQTRVQCLIFFTWHFLCRRTLQLCREFIGRNVGWGISIVSDIEMDLNGPAVEIMITADYIKMAARKHSTAELKRFLVKRTDLQAWIG